MSAIKLSTPSSGSISLSPADTASNLTITVPAVSATMATLTTPSFATTIGVGGATPAASGAGITFPATQSASSDANTLDDYEEGTFLASYGGSGGNPTVSYVRRNGRYVKIGQFVQITIEMQTSSVSGGSGSLQILGLPFTSLNDRYTGAGVTGYADTFVSQAPRAGYIGINDNTIWLTFANSATTQEPNVVSNLSTGANANYLIFTATYRASA
jgi:hypothetical protein